MSARAGDGVLAWKVLRRVGEFREAWDRHAAGHACAPDEPGPFRIRVQSETDREAARFGLLAWEDPRREGGPASPFWLEDGMPEGVVDPGAKPLAAMADGGFVEGLRLLSGGLVVKVECRGAAVQVLVGGGGPLPDGAGLRVMHDFGLRMPHSIGRQVEFWSVAGRAGPREGMGGREIGTERLLAVMDGLAAGRSARGIAQDVWGEEAVAREWDPTAGCARRFGAGSGRRGRSPTADGATSRCVAAMDGTEPDDNGKRTDPGPGAHGRLAAAGAASRRAWR